MNLKMKLITIAIIKMIIKKIYSKMKIMKKKKVKKMNF